MEKSCPYRSPYGNSYGNQYVNMANMKTTMPDEVVGMGYVPVQKWESVYEPCKALKKGTIFVSLDKPFEGGGKYA